MKFQVISSFLVVAFVITQVQSYDANLNDVQLGRCRGIFLNYVNNGAGSTPFNDLQYNYKRAGEILRMKMFALGKDIYLYFKIQGVIQVNVIVDGFGGKIVACKTTTLKCENEGTSGVQHVDFKLNPIYHTELDFVISKSKI